MSGPQPISYVEIDAWSRLTGETVTREELAVLIQMDDGYRLALAEELEVQRKARDSA